MNITIDREKIAGPLSRAAALARRTTIPILDCLKVSVADEKLTVVGTNLDIELVQTVGVEAGDPIEFCVHAARLAAFVKSADGARIEFEIGERSLVVRCGRARVSLGLNHISEFPAMNAPKDAVLVSVDASALCPALADAATYAENNSGRLHLCGVYLHSRRNRGALVATNGHQLSLAELTTETELNGCLIPVETCELVDRIFRDSEEPLLMEVSEERLRVSSGGIFLTSRLIDAKFPPYERLIPAPVESPVLVPAEDLAAAIARILLVVRDDGLKSPIAKLTFDGTVLTVSAGNAWDAVEIDSNIAIMHDGAPLSVGFQARYIAHALATLNVPVVEFHLTDPGSAVTLRAPGDDRRCVIVMPTRM